VSKRQRQPAAPAADTPSGRLRTIYGGDFAAALAALDQLRADLDDREHNLIAGERRRGATWEQIGQQLGCTKQSAHKRFNRPPGVPRRRRYTD
jgi:hypothetical protein